MTHRPLGRTGVKVSPLCLGAMMFGAWGNPDHDEGVRIIHAALDAGINFIDTADVYSRGESEEIVGKALEGRRDDVVLATKVHGTMGDDVNQFGNSRRWIIREVEDSLRRLKTDYIDLYQIHRPEADTDIDETLGALTDLVRQGKVRYIGSSTFPASQIVEAQWVARDRGRERFVCEQPPYSMLARGIEADVLPTCRRHGMARHPVVAAGRRVAERQVAQGPGRAGLLARPAHAGALRPVRPRQPAQARRRRRARAARRGGGADADPDGAGVRDQPPGGDRRDHRAAHAWSSSSRSSARTRWCSMRPSLTASMRSSRPGRRSPPPIPDSRTRT